MTDLRLRCRGNIIVMLEALVAMICLVLGTGRPPPATSWCRTLMAPVIVSIGAQNGLLPADCGASVRVLFRPHTDIMPPVGWRLMRRRASP
jgi:TRAP-type uncharacterized transport system fused permease subunit